MKKIRTILKKYFLLITVWLLTLVVTLPIMSYGVVKSWEVHKETLAHQIDALSDGFNHDIDIILASLNGRFPASSVCDQTKIIAMKEADYHATNLTNVAFVHDHQIICTSDIGLLDTPQPLPKPNWVTAHDVSVFLELPIPLFNGLLTGNTVQVGSFLAFLDYENSQSKTNKAWLKYINYGLVKGKKAYSYGDG